MGPGNCYLLVFGTISSSLHGQTSRLHGHINAPSLSFLSRLALGLMLLLLTSHLQALIAEQYLHRCPSLSEENSGLLFFGRQFWLSAVNWMVLSCYFRIFSIYFFMTRFAGGLRLAPSLCSFAGSSNCISCSTNLQHAIFVDIQFLKYGSWQLELPSSISDLNFFYKFWQDRYVFCRFEIQKMFSFWSRQSRSSCLKTFS